jgi:two-component system sensor histidine kinase BaeS
MAESLSNTERQRRQLTSDVAHELRTPLTNLRAQIEAIEDGLARPDAAVLRSLHEEVILLARLADDLQELTLTESRALRLDREALPVAPALESAATALRARANERGVALSVEPAPGLVVDADPGRLAQVLRNLLENAVGHTPSGGVVTMSAHAEGARVAIEVSDTGDGIEPEHLPNVFERFYRADPSRSRASGGAGLGLAIVRSLVEAHGGEVRIASEIGRGTRVTLYFPAVPGQ